MISDAALTELKSRHPCDQLAAKYVKLRRHGKKLIGPCPLHSPDPKARDSTAFECDADGWVCAVCHDGGDQIKLLMLAEKIDFVTAVEQLGGVSEPSPERAKEIEAEREQKREAADRENNVYRERAQKAARDIWAAGKPLLGSPAEAYLRQRGLTALPPGLELRFAPTLAYFHGEEDNEIGRKAPRVIHRGPALLAPIVDALGTLRAVHMTWLDASRPKGKAIIRDPETNDVLESKKVRGSKAGNLINLIASPEPEPSRWIGGEGIETVLSVWLAMHVKGRDLSHTMFCSTVDLGNLGGKAMESVPHPILKDARGRARMVPGPQPDRDAPYFVIPESVNDAILLGDGDSDRFETTCALVRAQARLSRRGRQVRTAWSIDGMDFNDMLRAA